MKDQSGSGHTIDGYIYKSSDFTGAHSYLLPALAKEVKAAFHSQPDQPKRLFDLGCGNGSVAGYLHDIGYEVVGVDPSHEGIKIAGETRPDMRLEVGSAYDDLAKKYGRFACVYSLEVVEHVYAPRDYAATLFDLTEPGGTAIVSTPYHGYIKNLAMAVTGKLDAHFTVLWDHGHIKFWSIRTLTTLLQEAGFENIRFVRVGRVPMLAKSMIAIASRPKQQSVTEQKP